MYAGSRRQQLKPRALTSDYLVVSVCLAEVRLGFSVLPAAVRWGKGKGKGSALKRKRGAFAMLKLLC